MMTKTFTQIYIQVIFGVRYRDGLIRSDWKERLHKYITGIARNKGHKLIAVNTMPDHAHVFIGMKPDEVLSDLVRDMKRDSTNFVNTTIRPGGKFAWQEGYGAFSYPRSEIDTVVKYILNQEEYHRTKTFREEYEGLNSYGVPDCFGVPGYKRPAPTELSAQAQRVAVLS